MDIDRGGTLFRKLGEEEKGKPKPWHLRFSPSGWRRWTRRPAATPAKGTSSSVALQIPHRRRRRRIRRLGSLLSSFIRSFLFRVVEAVEAVVLVAGLCFFFFRFGCRV